jgi:hypothetical protein
VSNRTVNPDLPAFRNAVVPWISQQVGSAASDLLPLPGGANNRVYQVHTSGRDLVLKWYFRHPADPRDRFAAERAFYTLVWRGGVRRTPEPVGWDETLRVGLLEFVEGRKLSAPEINGDAVRQALAFVTELNQLKTGVQSQNLPVASEACFSIAEHLACVEGRVGRLRGIPSASDLDREAAEFARKEVTPAWERIRGSVTAACPSLGWSLDETLAPAERCLSPSDFGFHNALHARDGQLRFLDFEYAGWDDPAKLICDFFCQPQLPVDMMQWDFFAGGVAGWSGLSSVTLTRAKLLLPVYRVKWCCIILNEFLRVDELRREFAQGTRASRKGAQLEKAHQVLASALSAV